MLIRQLLNPDSADYVITHAFRMVGPVDAGALGRAFDSVVTRHPALRTAVVENDGEIFRYTAPPSTGLLDVLDWTDHCDLDSALAEFIAATAAQPFDLTRTPLARAVLLQVAHNDAVLVLSLHHMAVDAVSVTVICADLGAQYRNHSDGAAAGATTHPADIGFYFDQFPDALPERNIVPDSRLAELMAVEPLELPGDTATTLKTIDYTTHRRTAPREVFAPYLEAAKRTGVTPFTALLTVFGLVVGNTTSRSRFLLGIPVSTRTPDTRATVGMFVNLVPVLIDLTGRPALGELLTRVHGSVWRAVEFADIPFAAHVNAIPSARRGRRPPLVQVLFGLTDNAPSPAIAIPGVVCRPLPSPEMRTEFDLECACALSVEEIVTTVYRNSDGITAASAQGMVEDFVSLTQVLSRIGLDQPVREGLRGNGWLVSG